MTLQLVYVTFICSREDFERLALRLQQEGVPHNAIFANEYARIPLIVGAGATGGPTLPVHGEDLPIPRPPSGDGT